MGNEKSIVFDNYSAYYDLINCGKDYTVEVEYILNKINEYNNSDLRILEIGSGTGGHASELIARGFMVDAIELSSQMLNVGLKSVHYNSSQGDIRNFKLPTRYKNAISIYHVLSYLRTDLDVIEALRNVRSHLVDGGLFLFDVWHTAGVYSLKPSRRIATASNISGKCIRIANPIVDIRTNTVRVEYEFDIIQRSGDHKQFNEVHIMRHFSYLEIERFANLSDFEIVGTEEFLSGKPLDMDVWGSFFILRAV